ncbi:hypothetical protein RND81_06G055000 [Saponaria officinalis]|uniref:Uncharacterized protein n=1 Tax=Saponaria officinalis TaxID=3572 RepID=A0AAW1K9C3_SAPOF
MITITSDYRRHYRHLISPPLPVTVLFLSRFSLVDATSSVNTSALCVRVLRRVLAPTLFWPSYSLRNSYLLLGSSLFFFNLGPLIRVEWGSEMSFCALLAQAVR